MLRVNTDKANHLAILEPYGPLSKNDFLSATKTIDSLIGESGRLSGIVIHAKSFPGWDSFPALLSHLRFVKDHHKQISRVALATDSIVANFAKAAANHFVAAEINTFSYQEIDKAIQWVKSGTQKSDLHNIESSHK
jgi:hypothetical protein